MQHQCELVLYFCIFLVNITIDLKLDIAVPNFIKISKMDADILWFFSIFQDGGQRPSWIFIFWQS